MIYNKLILPVTHILSSREVYTCTLLKRIDILSQKHLYCKKGKDKKAQVTEQPKDVTSLWSQEEKLYQLQRSQLHLSNSTLAAS